MNTYNSIVKSAERNQWPSFHRGNQERESLSIYLSLTLLVFLPSPPSAIHSSCRWRSWIHSATVEFAKHDSVESSDLTNQLDHFLTFLIYSDLWNALVHKSCYT